jgi:hypothetical protein
MILITWAYSWERRAVSLYVEIFAEISQHVFI